MSRKKYTADYGKKLGPHIEERRHEMGLSREELSARLDITTDYLGKLERGEQTPSYDLFVRLAITLGVSKDYLSQDFPGVNPKYALNEELAKAVDGDDDNDIRFYLEMIKAHHNFKDKSEAQKEDK